MEEPVEEEASPPPPFPSTESAHVDADATASVDVESPEPENENEPEASPPSPPPDDTRKVKLVVNSREYFFEFAATVVTRDVAHKFCHQEGVTLGLESGEDAAAGDGVTHQHCVQQITEALDSLLAAPPA